MDTITTYADFAPTPFDPRGLNLPDQQDWIVAPTFLNRDSGLIEESNWHTAIAILGDDAEIHRFGHWACGWIEIMIVPPSQSDQVQEIIDRLAQYPLLDESDHSEREWNAINEAWGAASIAERIDYCDGWGESIFAARRDSVWSIPNAEPLELIEA